MLKDFKNPDESVYYVLDNDAGVQENNVFLVGKFDIEDSIDDKYWIDLVKEQCGIISLACLCIDYLSFRQKG